MLPHQVFYFVVQRCTTCGPRRETRRPRMANLSLASWKNQSPNDRHSHLKFGKFGKNVALKVLISKKRSSLSFWLNADTSNCFEPYFCVETTWIANFDCLAKFSRNLKSARLQKGCTALSLCIERVWRNLPLECARSSAEALCCSFAIL